MQSWELLCMQEIYICNKLIWRQIEQGRLTNLELSTIVHLSGLVCWLFTACDDNVDSIPKGQGLSALRFFFFAEFNRRLKLLIDALVSGESSHAMSGRYVIYVMYVCIGVCVCMYVRTYVCMYLCMYMCICMYVCMYVCTYVRTFVYMYICMYVCLYVGWYVCMYV